MCIFMFSDIILEEKDRLLIIEIAKLLIKFGANKYKAKEFYIRRYGNPSKYNGGPWFTFYMLLCD